MYTTFRRYYRYGNETDYIDVTIKEFPTFEKALAYAERYAKGIKFAGVEIDNENYETVYEITEESDVFDYRNNPIKHV